MRTLYKLYKILRVAIRRLVSYWITDKFLVGIIVFVEKDDKLLLLRHSYQYHWALPGGWLRRTEQIDESIAREVKEETNLDIVVTRVFSVKNVIEPSVIDIALVARVRGGDIKVDGKEVLEARFFQRDNLPDDILGTHEPYIEAYLKVSHSRRKR